MLCIKGHESRVTMLSMEGGFGYDSHVSVHLIILGFPGSLSRALKL